MPTPELAARARVESFRVFAKNDEANIVFAAIPQRRERRIEQLHWPSVHVEVELGAEAQQNVRGVAIRRHPRIAHGAEKNGVEIASEHLHSVGRKRGAFAQEALRAPVEFHEISLTIALGDGGSQYLYRFWYDFPTDAVAGNNRNAFGVSFCGSGGVHEISVREGPMA